MFEGMPHFKRESHSARKTQFMPINRIITVCSMLPSDGAALSSPIQTVVSMN